VEALQRKERQDEIQFSTEFGGKLVWVPVISLCKIFIPSYAFHALLCGNWPFSFSFSPPNRETFWVNSNITWFLLPKFGFSLDRNQLFSSLVSQNQSMSQIIIDDYHFFLAPHQYWVAKIE
jgi:hypothetical protein